MASSDINAGIDAVSENIESLRTGVKNEVSRKKLLGVVTRAKNRLESPTDTIWGLMLSTQASAALMVLIRMGVVHELVKTAKPRTAKELSASCGGEEMLIIRMMRPVVALGVLREINVQTYESTPISEMLTTPSLSGGYEFMFDISTRTVANMPRYLERTNFKNVNGSPGPFQDFHNTEDGMFQHLIKNNLPLWTKFNDFMTSQLASRPEWHVAFPAKSILLEGAEKNDPKAVLLVDIGGGEGTDIASFHRAFPDAPGQLVVEDLPATIDDIKQLDPAIVRQKHDFFAAQPVQGARAYYFRGIFHNWPDAACVKIMRQTAAAMKRGYSKMLIFEWVLPAQDVPLFPALMDVAMMALLSGMERTEAQWTALLELAGLKVVKFHKTGADVEGLIEAELAD